MSTKISVQDLNRNKRAQKNAKFADKKILLTRRAILERIVNIYLTLNGNAEIIINSYKVDELWSPLVKIWFKEGKEDPNLSLIKVNTKDANYWDADGNKMVNFFKLIASAVTGKNLIDGNHGTLKV